MFRFATFRLAVLALLALAAFPSPSLAHRVNLFAYVDNGKVVADCFYSKSSKVRQGTVVVTDLATGEELLRGTTDDAGAFSFPIPEAARAAGHGLKLTLVAGEGHQNETEISAEELGAAPAPAEAVSAPAPAAAPAVAAEPAPAPLAAPAGGLDEAALARIVEQAVARQLAPVKQMLAQSRESGPGVTEIVGGIGYIFGLFGAAALWAGRRRR